MENKSQVIINEQHTLLPEQCTLLNEKFSESGWELLKVPSAGWSISDMERIIQSGELAGGCVFVSPIPYLIRELSLAEGRGAPYRAWLFHNDKREKKEIGGKIISVVASEGWQLI